MHESAHEPPEEHCVIERLFAIRLLRHSARVVQEYKIEIRAVRQFEAAEFAVANDAESGFANFAVNVVTWQAMLLRHISPCRVQRPVEYRFCEKGKTVADFHNR